MMEYWNTEREHQTCLSLLLIIPKFQYSIIPAKAENGAVLC
jgi:hypothetical protein